ncbi:MAG: aldo/keto reductase [Gammaproteobacteria bacterium]|nr:aldo/keto reductase [Gammaproteobacteria bacterium]
MRYRKFGRTGLEVSELVFGGGWVGGVLVHAEDEMKRTAVRRAIEAGINWIDTAPSYGDGKSETALGWLLPELGVAPYLSTKVRIELDDLDDIRGQVERSVAQSLERLQRDNVDLLQLHNPLGAETDGTLLGVEHVIGPHGVADAFERLREQGLFRFVGITALGEARACIDVIESGRFDSAQVYYNMLNPSADHAMPAAWSGHDFSGIVDACERRDVAVMAIRILAAGVLATDERHGREVVVTRDSSIEREEARARAVFAALGDAYGSRAQTAVHYVLSNSRLACAIIGLATPEHLEQALAAQAAGPLPADALQRLARVHESGFQ